MIYRVIAESEERDDNAVFGDHQGGNDKLGAVLINFTSIGRM